MPLHYTGGIQWVCNGFGMITPAMKPLNPELLDSDDDPMFDNTDLGGVDGTLPEFAFAGEAIHVIEYQMVGDVDHAGDPTASDAAGVLANHAELRAALHRDTWGGPTCVSEVTTADGRELAGPTQVKIGPLGRGTPPVVVFTVTVVVPLGRLLPVVP